MSSHTRAMLEGRIVPTLLRMAWPNILVMVAQSASGLIETWFATAPPCFACSTDFALSTSSSCPSSPAWGAKWLYTATVLGQIRAAGVRIWFYLTNEELKFDSATDKFMVSAVAFAAELEREKASQRSRDALLRKAEHGFNTGGRVYGYDNVPGLRSGGRWSAGQVAHGVPGQPSRSRGRALDLPHVRRRPRYEGDCPHAQR